MTDGAASSDMWEAGWGVHAREVRRGLAEMSAADRLAWLEDALVFALVFALESGALTRDRARRARAAADWPSEQPGSECVANGF